MKSLKALLDDLDAVGRAHDEIGDTEVREQMWTAVRHAFVDQTPGYRMPDKFGMFSEEGNGAVKETLQRFLALAVPEARALGLATPEQRLRSFEDGDIESDDGMFFDDYFGGSSG